MGTPKSEIKKDFEEYKKETLEELSSYSGWSVYGKEEDNMIIDDEVSYTENESEAVKEGFVDVLVGNSYDYKETLRENGYQFKSFYRGKTKVWCKTVKEDGIDRERELISTMPKVTYDIL